MRRLILLLAVTAVLAVGALVPLSGASFSSESTSTVKVAADRVQNWLHLYSQSTDPDGLTGYCTQAPDTSPAATGVDATLTVDLGTLKKGKNTTCDLVFTIKTPSAYPTGTSATITASLLPDAATDTQPINRFGFAALGAGSTYATSISLGPGQKRQLNLRVKPAAKGVTYSPTLLITVTYTGLSAGYYQYSVPITVTGG